MAWGLRMVETPLVGGKLFSQKLLAYTISTIMRGGI
jgi:hypothetical protein